jgi:hypothetical protein
MTNTVNGEPEGWLDLFRNRALHLVCVAAGGLTTCDFAASTLGDMRQEYEVWPLTRQVNMLGETGTFWPRLLLTVVPTPYWEGRPAPADLEEFYRSSFLDVAKANREHIRLDVLFVDLNGYGTRYDFGIARSIAEAVLSNEAGIETLYFAPKAT